MSAKIQTTTNYDLFEICSFNRDVRKLDNMRSSMTKHGFIPAYPLHCAQGQRGKLVVKAGHHRLETAKQLKIPVHYVVTQDVASVHELEKASRAWSYKDFMLSHARAGSAAHLAIVDFANRTGILLSQATSMLGGESAVSHNMAEKAKDGSIVIGSTEHAELVGSIVIAMKAAGVGFAASSNLVNAISCVVYVPEFESDVFFHRVSTNLHMMIKQSTYMQYLDLVERVYNHGARNKIPLAFMAKELAKKRSAIPS